MEAELPRSSRAATRARRWACAASLVVLATAALALPARAGTICGTVRDASTSIPIPGAGVFVRYPDGPYTGYSAATDSAGKYCVEGVPGGTYDLEIRVNDYQTTYVRDVVVTGDVTGVDADVPPTIHLRAWPNPARDRLSLRVEVPDPPARLEILDVRGRFVRGWRIEGSGVREFSWDVRTAQGTPLPGGVYFLWLRSSRHHEVGRFVVVR